MIPLQARLIRTLAGAVAICAAYHWLPVVGPHTRILRVEKARDAALDQVIHWKDAFERSEKNRQAEAANALTSAANVNATCDARVDLARKSGKAINAIVSAPPRLDPVGCPVRRLVDPGLVRDATGAPTG